MWLLPVLFQILPVYRVSGSVKIRSLGADVGLEIGSQGFPELDGKTKTPKFFS